MRARLSPLPLLLALGLAAPLAGCGGPTNGTHCGDPGGVLLLAWTINGQAPVVACKAPIDLLEIDVSSTQCVAGASIVDVICNTEKFRYDNLPLGDADVTVTALDVNGRPLYSGSALIRLGTSPPATPVPIDLR